MPIHLPEERLIQVRFLLDLVRLMSARTAQQRLSFDQVELLAAVVMGELEGRPFHASSLASFLEVPRPTLVRKMAALANAGFIERRDGHYFTNQERINHPDVIGLMQRLTALILTTADQLQRLKGGQ